jgi:hypothetical protein
LELHECTTAAGHPTQALLQRMLSTINAYYGIFMHANTYQLRQRIYHQELKGLRQYFRPDGPGYQHLRIRKVWQAST